MEWPQHLSLSGIISFKTFILEKENKKYCLDAYKVLKFIIFTFLYIANKDIKK